MHLKHVDRSFEMKLFHLIPRMCHVWTAITNLAFIGTASTVGIKPGPLISLQDLRNYSEMRQSFQESNKTCFSVHWNRAGLNLSISLAESPPRVPLPPHLYRWNPSSRYPWWARRTEDLELSRKERNPYFKMQLLLYIQIFLDSDWDS